MGQCNRKRDAYIPAVYSVSSEEGKVMARGHAGLHLSRELMEDQRKSALDWLLKGRKPEKMNPVNLPAEIRVTMRDQINGGYRNRQRRDS